MTKLDKIRKALEREASTPATIAALALFLFTLAIWAATLSVIVDR